MDCRLWTIAGIHRPLGTTGYGLWIPNLEIFLVSINYQQLFLVILFLLKSWVEFMSKETIFEWINYSAQLFSPELGTQTFWYRHFLLNPSISCDMSFWCIPYHINIILSYIQHVTCFECFKSVVIRLSKHVKYCWCYQIISSSTNHLLHMSPTLLKVSYHMIHMQYYKL